MLIKVFLEKRVVGTPMKILFVMPSLDNGYWKKLGKKVGPKSEPLSLLYIATYLNKNGHHAEVVDCEAEGLSLEDLEAKIQAGNYDVVGGSHANLRPKETAEKEDAIDVVTVGEAELTFMELIEVFQGRKALKDV